MMSGQAFREEAADEAGTHGPIATIKENIFEISAFRRATRAMVMDPAWLLVTSMPVALLLIGMVPPEFDLPWYTVISIYILRIVVWGGILLLLLPGYARWCMQRNIPFVVAYLSLLMGALVFSNLVTWLVKPDYPVDVLMMRYLRQIGLGFLLTCVLLLVIERDIRNLGADPALVPVWLPVRARARKAGRAGAETADISLLEPSLSGAIRAIHSQNQYVEVETAERVHLLRMPLHLAIARMPSGAGHRVHRSWWLASNVPSSLRRQGQNFEVLDSEGRIYPVSRPNLELVRNLVERNRAMQ